MTAPVKSFASPPHADLRGDRFDIVDPATGLAFASAALCDEFELEEAVQAALIAQPKWASSLADRRNALGECAKLITRAQDALAHLITLEQGKPLVEARREVAYTAAQFSSHANLALPPELLGHDDRARTLLLQRPFGVVGVITPWNFPLGTAAVKLAPALLAGNAVILKPSHHAPLSALRLHELLGEVLPRGILHTLSGGDHLGALIARHPRIRKVSLTGSISTGRSVLADGVAELKSITLELGGNDPAIILPDANPRHIAQPLLAAAWRNAGQVCSAIKRVYVHETQFAPLLRTLQETAAGYAVGNGLLPTTRVGPLTTDEQRNRVNDLAARVVTAGGTLHVAGSCIGESGYFVQPAIATGVNDSHPLVSSEQFGPVLPILTYDNIADAITRANDSEFGLSASVWTKNQNLGYEVGCQLHCGRVGINAHQRSSIAAPFGGWKHSGLGRELGIWGVLAMCEAQVVNIFN